MPPASLSRTPKVAVVLLVTLLLVILALGGSIFNSTGIATGVYAFKLTCMAIGGSGLSLLGISRGIGTAWEISTAILVPCVWKSPLIGGRLHTAAVYAGTRGRLFVDLALYPVEYGCLYPGGGRSGATPDAIIDSTRAILSLAYVRGAHFRSE
jgi:hypothetical protein